MAIEYAPIEVNAENGVTVKNTLSYNNEPPSNHLLVILPGRQYYIAHPVLHYLAKVGLTEGFDVLPIQYAFQVAPDRVKGTGNLVAECRQAMTRALERGYGHICIAGKSLGSPLAVQLAKESPIKNVSLILLTPVGTTAQDAGDIPALSIIGTADPMYNEKTVEADDRLTMLWRVYEKLNHGLEIEGNWRASLDALNTITAECESFLRGVKEGTVAGG